eukprot:jgi/Picre1/30372/NNA_005736.t1
MANHRVQIAHRSSRSDNASDWAWRSSILQCENFSVLSGHKNAVLQVQWTGDGEHLVSCSPDTTVRSWDAMTGEQVGIMKDHTDIVNCCSVQRRGTPMAVSGSDDCSVKLWDMRAKGATKTLTERYQITAVDISEDGDQVFTGGIDNTVKVWDVRKDDVIMTLEGHSDTITGMEVSPSGTHLLTNSMDNTMRSWDVRPYAPDSRCVRVFTGISMALRRICSDAHGQPMVNKYLEVVVIDLFIYGALQPEMSCIASLDTRAV